MPTLYLLGTGAAVSDPHRTTTMLAVSDGASTIAVDCGGDVIQRMMEAGIDVDTLDALIVTHEHPDHVSGFPLFMEKIWLLGRRRPIAVHGIREAIDQAARCFEAFDTSSWSDMPDIQWREIVHEPGSTVLQDERWRITSTPGKHGVPVIALRFEHISSERAIAYSCDTEPLASISELAQGTSILVHEATGESKGHSSAAQAAEVARDARTGRLLLVHVPAKLNDAELRAARKIFQRTEIGVEGGRYEY